MIAARQQIETGVQNAQCSVLAGDASLPLLKSITRCCNGAAVEGSYAKSQFSRQASMLFDELFELEASDVLTQQEVEQVGTQLWPTKAVDDDRPSDFCFVP